jgi:hypothetical protein
MFEKREKHAEKCYDCNGPLELYEVDMSKSTKIMFCPSCKLFHFYKKDFIGNNRLIRVSKNPETRSDKAKSAD